MKNLTFFLIVLYFSLISDCFAQVTLQWKHVYKGIEDKGYYPSEMAVDDSGNVFITGTSFSGFFLETSLWDFTTIKYNSVGEIQWSHVYGNPGYIEDVAYHLAIDRQRNVYVTGISYDTILDKGSCVTMKYNSSGELQWVNSFSDLLIAYNFYDRCGMVVDDSQNVYVFFNSREYSQSTHHASNLIKYNSDGSLEWRQRFTSDYYPYTLLICLQKDNFNNVYLGGYTVPRGSFIKKFNPQGDLLWTAFYPKYIYNESMDIDSIGNVYIIGSSDSTRIVKFSNSGTLMWERVFTKENYTTSEDYRKKILIGRDNKILAMFPVHVSGSFNNDIYVLKLNPSGETIWQRTYARDSTSYEYTSALCEDSRGDVYVSGYSYSVGAGINDTYVILQYTSTGETVRIIRKAGTEIYNNYHTTDMVIDTNKNIIITGNFYDSVFYDKCLTMKFVQPVGITQTSNKIPSEYKLYQNYPNPFNPKTKIKFQISKLSDVKLIVYDILGREVATLVNERLKAGTYEVEFTARHGGSSTLPSGVYFYTLKAEYFKETKKMILIK